MTNSDGLQIGGNKFNQWCERKGLICDDQSKIKKAYQYTARKDLTKAESSAFFLHELTNCDGFEFVAFSSAKLPSPITLKDKIILVPCFKTSKALDLKDPVNQKTIEMEKRSRFIYDGWIPIIDWSEEQVRNSIKKIDKALSAFSLKVGTYFEWKPKYDSDQGSSFLFTTEHLQELELVTSRLEKIPKEDQEAIYRSFGWLSQAFRLNEPAAKFLFLILTIESLVTYIEKEANDDSSLIQFRADTKTKSERRADTTKCLEN